MAYSPASALIGTGLPTSQAVYYDRQAVENLKAHLPFLLGCSRRPLPLKHGKTMQIFSPVLFAANTTQATEGTIGTGITPTENKLQVTIGQYTDYVSFSDFLLDVAIVDSVAEFSKELGYRAALTVNTLVQQEIDAAVSNDTTVNSAASAAGQFLTSALIRARVQDLRGRNAHAISDGKFLGFIHPFSAGDLYNDTANNGLVDVLKRSVQGAALITDGTPDNRDYEIFDWAGVRWIETTTCPSGQTVGSVSNCLNSYIIAKDAFIAVSLGATEVPKDRNFRLMVSSFTPNQADPALQIKAAAAYNFKFAVTTRPLDTMIFERLQYPSAIA